MRSLALREDPQNESGTLAETLPELLHRLQQPLTALHCVLEVGLMKPRGGEEYRAALQKALAEADRVLRVAAMIREHFGHGIERSKP